MSNEHVGMPKDLAASARIGDLRLPDNRARAPHLKIRALARALARRANGRLWPGRHQFLGSRRMTFGGSPTRSSEQWACCWRSTRLSLPRKALVQEVFRARSILGSRSWRVLKNKLDPWAISRRHAPPTRQIDLLAADASAVGVPGKQYKKPCLFPDPDSPTTARVVPGKKSSGPHPSEHISRAPARFLVSYRFTGFFDRDKRRLALVAIRSSLLIFEARHLVSFTQVRSAGSRTLQISIFSPHLEVDSTTFGR